MSWTVEYNAEIGVVQCTYMGQVTADEFKEGTIKAIALAKDNDTKLFLIDDSKWQGGLRSSVYLNCPFSMRNMMPIASAG